MNGNLFYRRYRKYLELMPKVNAAWDDSKAIVAGESICIPYRDKLGNCQEAIEAVQRVLRDNGKRTLICAETGSGKTWLLLNEIKKYTQEQIQQEDGFYKKRILNIYLVPNKVQVKQSSRQYGIKGITAGDSIYRDELEKNNEFIMVYDKVDELLYYLNNTTTDLRAHYKINFVVDEAHLLYQAEHYRPVCIRRIFRAIEQVERLGGNIIMTTASFETLVPLPFDRTIVFYREQEAPAPQTSIVVKPHEVYYTDFIIREIAKVLRAGKKAYVRLNDKQFAHQLSDELEKKGLAYEFAFLNSDEKEEVHGAYANETLANLVYHNDLMEKQVWFCTSMVDAGMNIDTVGGKHDEDICVLYCCDTNNMQIDNIEQSFNRFRFYYNERKVLLCNSNKDLQPVPLEDILKHQYTTLKRAMDAYNALYQMFETNYGREKAIELIKGQLEYICTDGTTSASNLYLDENRDVPKVVYDPIAFFRFCREKLYMYQFLNPDLLKTELERVLGGEVNIVDAYKDNSLVIFRETEEERKAFFSELMADDKRADEFDRHYGRDWDRYAESPIGEMYKILRRYNSSFDTLFYLATYSTKDLNKIIKQLCKADIAKLDTPEKDAITAIIKGQSYKKPYNAALVGNVMQGEYKNLLKKMIIIGVDNPFQVIAKSEKDTEIRQAIIKKQTILVNNQYMKKYPPAGKFETEQYAFIRAVEKVRSASTITLKKSGEYMDAILADMNTGTKQGKTYDCEDIIEMAKRVYGGRNLKAGYLIKKLRIKDGEDTP